jgi:hypothetical protein
VFGLWGGGRWEAARIRFLCGIWHSGREGESKCHQAHQRAVRVFEGVTGPGEEGGRAAEVETAPVAHTIPEVLTNILPI